MTFLTQPQTTRLEASVAEHNARYPLSDPKPADSPLSDRLMLAETYPDCFNWVRPRPLKVGIHHDLLAAGYTVKQIRLALGLYCGNRGYAQALRPGAVRLDLQGRHAGVVTPEEAETGQSPGRSAVADALRYAPFPEENLVPGRLELKVKFSEMPQPVRIGPYYKIGIRNEQQTVVAVLRPRAWKRLEQADEKGLPWVATLSGPIDCIQGNVITLKHPLLALYEKKPKPAPDTTPRYPE